MIYLDPEGDISDPQNLDPKSLGFMCGIEVHQQLATGKLHSRQPGELHDITIDTLPEDWPRVKRRLRSASGEGGAIDVAARFEERRKRSFIYCQSPNSGLIELDEQPPLPHDSEALDVSLTVSAMIGAKPVPLLQTMRKTVVDGSNTSGFQRTTLVSTDGVLDTEGGPVGVDVLCLEEDSARKLSSELTPDGEVVTWNLDRLGIPLIEIATGENVNLDYMIVNEGNGHDRFNIGLDYVKIDDMQTSLPIVKLEVESRGVSMFRMNVKAPTDGSMWTIDSNGRLTAEVDIAIEVTSDFSCRTTGCLDMIVIQKIVFYENQSYDDYLI